MVTYRSEVPSLDIATFYRARIHHIPARVSMTNLPFMPLWVDRFFGGTLKMDGEEQSLYLLLLAHAWATGPLPTDPRRLAKLVRYDEKRFLKLWPRVQEKFIATDEGLVNESLESKRNTANTKRDKAKSNGSVGGLSKWGVTDGSKAKRSERLANARRLGTHSAREWAALIWVCGSACVRCGESSTKPVKDHIKPIYQGGSDAISNLQPLCASCNSSKGPDTTDHRPNDWEERLARCLANASQNASQVPTSVPDISELRIPEVRVRGLPGEES